MLSLGLLLALLPHSAAVPPAGAAPQEELDILVYGVLQFSQALHETLGTTGQRLEQARHRLQHCQRSLGALQRQARQAQQGVEELRRAAERLKAEEAALQLETHSRTQTLRVALAEHLRLAQRLKALERTLAGLATLKTHGERQNVTLRSLGGAAREGEQLAQLREQLQGHARDRT